MNLINSSETNLSTEMSEKKYNIKKYNMKILRNNAWLYETK